jgi:hypothetical protein
MDMRFGTLNVRSMYRVGSLMKVSRELTRYRLDLVVVQEVTWEGSGTESEGDYIFFYGREGGMRTMNYVQFYFCKKGIISAVKRGEFVSDRMPYIIPSGRWFNLPRTEG